MNPPLPLHHKPKSNLREPIFTLADVNRLARKLIAARHEGPLDYLLDNFRFSDDGAFLVQHDSQHSNSKETT